MDKLEARGVEDHQRLFGWPDGIVPMLSEGIRTANENAAHALEKLGEINKQISDFVNFWRNVGEQLLNRAIVTFACLIGTAVIGLLAWIARLVTLHIEGH